jgi:hypothetical protein
VDGGTIFGFSCAEEEEEEEEDDGPSVPGIIVDAIRNNI